MKKRPSMFMFGMRCVRCDHEIIAPHKTELLDTEVIRHLWHCSCCKAVFESFPRFPPNARSVKEVTMSVDVFPPLNEMRDI
jgi:hypothetical protein